MPDKETPMPRDRSALRLLNSLVLWMDALVFGFQQVVQFCGELIENLRVFFIHDLSAQVVHSFTFFRRHGGIVALELGDSRTYYKSLHELIAAWRTALSLLNSEYSSKPSFKRSIASFRSGESGRES